MTTIDETVDDLKRRVAALERASEAENSIRHAVAEIVAESEQGLRLEMSTLRTETKIELRVLRAEVQASEQRLTERVSATETRVVDLINEKHDEVMAALDRFANPPR